MDQIAATTKALTTAATTVIATVTLNGGARLVSAYLTNNSGQTTNAFKIQRQFFKGGPWVDYLSGTDFDTATGVCNASVTGPHELPTGQTAWVDFNPGAVYAVQFLGGLAAGTGNVTLGGIVQ